MGEGHFPVGKPIEFLISIWYNCYKYQRWIIGYYLKITRYCEEYHDECSKKNKEKL